MSARFDLHVPRPPLADLVEVLWRFVGPEPAHARQRLLPTGTIWLDESPMGRWPPAPHR